MSDASQDVPDEAVAERLANAIETLLADWSPGQPSAKITLAMTQDQWSEVLSALRAGLTEQGFD